MILMNHELWKPIQYKEFYHFSISNLVLVFKSYVLTSMYKVYLFPNTWTCIYILQRCPLARKSKKYEANSSGSLQVTQGIRSKRLFRPKTNCLTSLNRSGVTFSGSSWIYKLRIILMNISWYLCIMKLFSLQSKYPK